MLSAYLTEEATLMLLLFLSKYWKYNYDQKSITENAFVTFPRWTIFFPVSKICPFKQTSSQHIRKNRQKFTLQSSEVCNGSIYILIIIRNRVLSIFLFLTYIFVFVFISVFNFFAPFVVSSTEFHDQMKLTWMKLSWLLKGNWKELGRL